MTKSKNYLTTNGLMKYLRASGINIEGSAQKQQLINCGYYHGYKGYRFYQAPAQKIPITEFKQLVAIIKYDSNLKALFYPHLMYIETALKNITLDIVLKETNSNQLNDIFDKLMAGYANQPKGTKEKTRKDRQQQKLKLQKQIRDALFQAYHSNHNIVTHFYQSTKYDDVPLWAVYEIISLGTFGFFISCLNINTREKISRFINLDLSGDTDRRILEKLIYVIKDLRNAVAHDDVVFDTRFRITDAGVPLKTCLKKEIQLPHINFSDIIDYVVLIVYILKKLKVSNREMRALLSGFEKCIKELKKEVSAEIYTQLVHVDTPKKINIANKYLT
jgi:abortive infection bacteriophage resistance protein